MHIETLEGNGASYRQALVRFPRVAAAASWWSAYKRRMAAVAGLDVINTGYRLNVRADGRIGRMFGALFAPGSESAARRSCGGLGMLEAHARDSVDFPETASQFASWTADFPTLRCQIAPMRFQVGTGNAWLACDFRVATHLDILLGEAQSLGLAFGYQAHFRPFRSSIEQQRRIGRNVIALQSMDNVPADLIGDQQRQALYCRSATLLMEEVVAVDGHEATRWLTSALARLFTAGPVGARVEVPAFRFCADED